MKKRKNYLNNKDMLREIHRSKMSFSEFTAPEYTDFDTIIVQEAKIPDGKPEPEPPLINHPTESVPYDISIITPEVITEAKRLRAARLTLRAVEAYLKENPEGHKRDVTKILPEEIDEADLVYRVLSHDHVPFEPGRKKNPKTVADTKVRVNFYPYKHYIVRDNALVEVGRSHWKDGEFSLTSGCITDTLARMFLMLVNRYSQRSNWRGYTYVDEMKGQALMQLSQMGLQFNEHKSNNPFAYYTATVSNAFTRVLNTEKVHQTVRDDMLEQRGQTASFSRQLANEEEIRRMREVNDHVPGHGLDK